MVCVRALGVVRQRFAQGNNRVETLNLDIVSRGMKEVSRGSGSTGKLQQFGRRIYTRYVESRIYERFRQGPSATAHIHYSADSRAAALKAPHNLACRAPRRALERRCVDIR